MYLANKCILLMVLIAAPAFAQERIEMFTESPANVGSVNAVEVIHYDLSEPSRLKKRLAPKLPADEKLALIKAKQFFTSEEGKAYQIAMRDAYRGRQKMMQYQLKKIPAIVFDDGKYVIYGSTDVAQATMLYRQHIESIREQ